MTDSFYTPPKLAKKLVDHVKLSHVKSVADFCVGDGELLRAAQDRWSNAKFIATDISQRALEGVKEKHPKWGVEICDFLSQFSRDKCELLKNSKKIDLVLLNPPFSCVGSTKHQIHLDGDDYSCSTAMAFLIEALKYLKPKGGLYAILPCSVAYSEKDRKIWNKLVNEYKLKVLKESQKKYFDKCSPNILLVSINTNGHKCKLTKITRVKHNISSIVVIRGKVSMNTIKKGVIGNTSLVHSTNLQNQKIVDLNISMTEKAYVTTGAAVLIPRVGNPRKDKVCILHSKQKVILSDCVIALKTKTLNEAKKLQKLILDNWDIFFSLYQGTGAKYITIARIKETLGIFF
ncbi:MAG: methyltransferase [Victivallaceae bacterium]|nr:methyltransferase [Victivallaceae bacterium]